MRKGELTLAVTTDVLDEYEEILEQKYGNTFAQAALDAITTLENIRYITKYFFWNAIPQDPDAEKFFDCAVSANDTVKKTCSASAKITSSNVNFSIKLTSVTGKS